MLDRCCGGGGGGGGSGGGGGRDGVELVVVLQSTEPIILHAGPHANDGADLGSPRRVRVYLPLAIRVKLRLVWIVVSRDMGGLVGDWEICT